MIPTPLDQLGSTPFSFYPPILNIEHNEWIFRRSTWDEIHVVNTKTAVELCVPRQFVGEVSMVAEPVIIVGLIKELEHKEGLVYPHLRRVIEMPHAVNDSPRPRIRPQDPRRPAPVVGIRLESRGKGRMLLGAVAAGLLVCIGAFVLRDSAIGSRAISAATRIELPLTAADDYDSIVSRYGPPAADHWRTAHGTDYRRLAYPRHGFALILLQGHYAAAVDAGGRIVHNALPAAELRFLR